MSNKKRIGVDDAFIRLLKNKLAHDREVLHSANEQDKIAHRINKFIRQDLESYDKNLHARIIQLSGGDYPGKKTVERAFFKDRLANIDLLDICGWYIFEDEWKTERKQFSFELQQQKDEVVKGNSVEATVLDAKKNIKLDVDQKEGASTVKLHDIKAGGSIDVNIKQE